VWPKPLQLLWWLKFQSVLPLKSDLDVQQTGLEPSFTGVYINIWKDRKLYYLNCISNQLRVCVSQPGLTKISGQTKKSKDKRSSLVWFSATEKKRKSWCHWIMGFKSSISHTILWRPQKCTPNAALNSHQLIYSL